MGTKKKMSPQGQGFQILPNIVFTRTQQHCKSFHKHRSP